MSANFTSVSEEQNPGRCAPALVAGEVNQKGLGLVRPQEDVLAVEVAVDGGDNGGFAGRLKLARRRVWS